MKMSKSLRSVLMILVSLLAVSFSARAADSFETVPYVDLASFMGPWFVQGHTPLIIDQGASNQVETYELKADGTIATTFTFERGGRQFALHPTGKVANTQTNAHWKMQFLWPFSSDYLIVRLAQDGSVTVVSVPDKSLIWIMSRAPQMSDVDYNDVVADLETSGYPVAKIRRVEQDPR